MNWFGSPTRASLRRESFSCRVAFEVWTAFTASRSFARAVGVLPPQDLMLGSNSGQAASVVTSPRAALPPSVAASDASCAEAIWIGVAETAVIANCGQSRGWVLCLWRRRETAVPLNRTTHQARSPWVRCSGSRLPEEFRCLALSDGWSRNPTRRCCGEVSTAFLPPEISARFRGSATQGRYLGMGKAVPHSSVNCTPRLSRTRVRD